MGIVQESDIQMIVNLLLAQTRVAGAALLMVTADPRVLSRFDRILTLDAGRLHEQNPFDPIARQTEPLVGPAIKSVNIFATDSR